MRRLKFILCISLILLLSGCGLKFNFRTANNNLSNNTTVSTSIEINNIDTPSIDMTSILDKLSDLANKLSNDNGKEVILQHLSTFKEKSGLNLATVFFGDELGNFYIFPTSTLPDDYDARTRIWYKNAKENSEYVSDAYTDYATNGNLLAVAKAIHKDKNLIGVVGIDLILENNAKVK